MPSQKKTMKKLVNSLVLTFSLGTTLLSFQNCGSMEAGLNPLYYASMSGCYGITCGGAELSHVHIQTPQNVVMLSRPQIAGTNGCTDANCFDLGGSCEVGGYAGSVFYYQWLLGGNNAQSAVRTAAKCDDNGRFHVRVQTPSGFDWNLAHSLVLEMKVIDEEGSEFSNPTLTAQVRYTVQTRTGN